MFSLSDRLQPRIFKNQCLASRRAEIDHGARLLSGGGDIRDLADAELGVTDHLSATKLTLQAIGFIGEALAVFVSVIHVRKAGAIGYFKKLLGHFIEKRTGH